MGRTPNQVTTVRLILGLVSVGLVAWGTPAGNLWGGVFWLLSALLDRLDGEMARIGNLSSAWGQRYDYFVDTGLSAAFFVALGLGLRNISFGAWAIGFGLAACLGQLAANWMAEQYDKRAPSGDKVIPQFAGFDADDALYLLGPLVWLPAGVRSVAVVLAGVGTVGFLIFFSFRLARLKARLAATPV
jgi:archaetidylinositol phosphate synthase